MDMSACEKEWSAAASTAASSSLASLTLTLPSVAPIPAAPDTANANRQSDDVRLASNVPIVLTPSSSRRPRKKLSFPAWYRVGGANKELVVSPRRPRTDSPRRAPTPSIRPVNNATSPTMPGVLSPFDQSAPHTAATETGNSSAEVAAPMHGQLTADPRAGKTTRHVAVRAPSPFRTENLGKRNRGGNRNPVSTGSGTMPVRNRTGLVKGRVDSSNGHRSDSIPSKSRRISDSDVEPVLTSQLPVRRREAVVGLPGQCDDVSGDLLTRVAGAREVDRGTQAACGRPLVPRPSSPRSQGECHPWHFSLARLLYAEMDQVMKNSWRLEAGPASVSANCDHRPGPTPQFPTKDNERGDQRPLQGSQRGQGYILRLADPAGPNRENTPSSGRNAGDGDSAVGSERTITALRTDSSISDKRDAADSLQGADGRVRASSLLRKKRVRSLMETSCRAGADKARTIPASDRDDTERRLLQDEQGSSRSGENDSPRGSRSKIVSVRLRSSSSRGARWGQCVYDPDGDELDENGGISGPVFSQGFGPDKSCIFPKENKVLSLALSQAGHGYGFPKTPIVGSRDRTPTTASSTIGRTVLAQASTGDTCVPEGAGLAHGTPDGNKESSTQGDSGENKNGNPGEGIDSSGTTKKLRTSKIGPAGGRARAKAKKMTIMDVALAAAQRKREAKLKSKDMLKTARGLVLKGRWKRAHTILCEAIAFNGAPKLMVILHELRARVRGMLGLWVEASEDIRLALKGLEQSEDVMIVDPDEERMEEATLSGKKRWRAIVNRVILHRRHAQAGFATTVSTFLAARRGLRARVMLAAAKCLAHENKLEAAIECTREVRALAARHSALPGGSSGVASTVTHEAFKLEIQWLQDTDHLPDALVTAREMDAQVKRDIYDQHLQGDDRPATENGTAGGSGFNDRRGLVSILFSDAEEDDANPDENYEAAVWAKVTLAELSTRNLAERQKRAGGGKSRGGANVRRKKRKRKKKAPDEATAAGMGASPALSFGKVASAAVEAAASALAVDPSRQPAKFGHTSSSAETVVSNIITTGQHSSIEGPNKGGDGKADSTGGRPETGCIARPAENTVGSQEHQVEMPGDDTVGAAAAAFPVATALCAKGPPSRPNGIEDIVYVDEGRDEEKAAPPADTAAAAFPVVTTVGTKGPPSRPDVVEESEYVNEGGDGDKAAPPAEAAAAAVSVVTGVGAEGPPSRPDVIEDIGYADEGEDGDKAAPPAGAAAATFPVVTAFGANGPPSRPEVVGETGYVDEVGDAGVTAPPKLALRDQASGGTCTTNDAQRHREEEELVSMKQSGGVDDFDSTHGRFGGANQLRSHDDGHKKGPQTSGDGPVSHAAGSKTMTQFTNSGDRAETRQGVDDEKGLEARQQGTVNNGCVSVLAEGGAEVDRSNHEKRCEGDSDSECLGEDDDDDDDEDENKDREEGLSEDEEEPAKTDINRCELEAAADSLEIVLSDEQLAWRADIRTPRILATAFERLADLSKDPDENDPAKNNICAEVEETPLKAQPSRQEILESGEETLRRVFAALEENLSSLVSTWKPLWRSHCHSKNIHSKRGKGGWGRLKSLAGDGGLSLPEMARELFISVAEAGVDIEAHVHHGVVPMADSIGGVGDGGDDSGEELRPGTSHGGGGKQKKRRRLPKGLAAHLTQLLKVLNIIAVVLEQRAHMAELAGEDPEDTIIPLFERAIAYLCLPRKSPPGGPSVIGMEIFGDGVSTSTTKAKVTSLRAACMAAVAAKKRKKGAQTKTIGKQTGPVSANAGEETALPSASPSPPRQRSALPLANTTSAGGHKLRTAASATNVKAAKSFAEKASSKATGLLLPWDAGSLTSLLGSHQALAATLLRLERSRKLSAGPAPRENQPSSTPSASTDAESVGTVDNEGDDVHGDDTEDQHHWPPLKQSTELLMRADASLTAALAAAGVGVGPVASPVRADPNTAISFPEATGIWSKNSESGITPAFDADPPSPPRLPSAPSRLSTRLNMLRDDEGSILQSVVDRGSPALPASAISPVIPVTVLTRDAGAEHSMADREREAPFQEPQGEEVAVSSPPLEHGGDGDADCSPGHGKGENEPRQRNSRDGSVTNNGNNSLLATFVPGVKPTAVAKLYSMRCVAKEGLGLTGDAFKDCLAAIEAAPEAPKLWAKAASLALLLGSDAERREKSGKNTSTTALSEQMAREAIRLASGLLQLCPRSHQGFLFRGQAAERVGQYDRAMRDYCRAQHVRPSSTVPALLRARLDALRGRLDAERPGGGTGERQAADAVEAMRAFLWSSFLPVDDATLHTPGTPGFLPREPRETEKIGAGGARIGELTVSWWKGRVKELEGSYMQASELYERVHEQQPRIDRLNRLASTYLSAMQPGKAEQVLSKFLESAGSSVRPSSAAAMGKRAAGTTSPERYQDALSVRRGTWASHHAVGFSTARVLRGRALFVLGNDEKCTASFKSALKVIRVLMKGGFDKAGILFEWSLSEAISTCMRLAASRVREGEENSDGNVTVVGPPLPAVTGIAAWDSALLEDYRRRQRAQQLAAAAAAAVAAAAAEAAAAEASELSVEDEDVHPSPPRDAQNRGDNLDDSNLGAKMARGKRPRASMVTMLQVPGAVSAAAATATATAPPASCFQVSGAFCEENNDGHDVTSSESVDSMSTSSGMAGSSDDDRQGYDSARQPGGQDGGLGSLDHGSGSEIKGEHEHGVQDTSEQQPPSDYLDGDGELGMPIDHNSEGQYLRDDERERVEVLQAGESPSGGGTPPGVQGASKSSPLRSRRRARKLRGFHGALELATRCLSKDGFNAKAYSLRAELEARLGRRDRAIADFRAAASLEVGDPRPRMNMALVHLNTSRSGLACAQFDSIERGSKGSVERVLAAFNLGVAAATAGELPRAEAAFTRALRVFSAGGASRDIVKLVTPATCLANRGLVKLAMKRFRGAAEDLGGVVSATAKVSKITRTTTTVFGVDPAVASTGVGTTTLAGGALDCLDSELGRGLAEGRLHNRASREAAGNRLRKLLRSARLLACEVAAVRIGLGNLAATAGETRGGCSKYFPARATEADQGSDNTERMARARHLKKQHATVGAILADEKGGCGAAAGRALRQFLHAIHACPTTSAAWLNASEILETAVEQSDETTRKFATGDRKAGDDSVGGHPDSVHDRSATKPEARHHLVGTKTTETAAAVVAHSLVLVDSVLAMVPSHQAALRCRSSILARLGHAPDALIAADRAVFEAETAVSAARAKSKEPGSGCASELASTSPSTSLFFPTAAAAGGENHPGRRYHGDALTSAEAYVGGSEKARAAENGESAGVGDDGHGGGIDGGGQWYSSPQSIGFMRSSKVNVAVGGLLLTGGGSASTLDVAKSLVLRGCLRQKMGRRKQAEDDYRQALTTCHNLLREIEGRLASSRPELSVKVNNRDPTVTVRGDKYRASVKMRWKTLRNGYAGGTGGQSNAGEKGCCAHGRKRGNASDDANNLRNNDGTRPACDEYSSASRSCSEACKGAVESGNDSDYQDIRCEILKMESLIHHNLATLHLATILGTDVRVSLHKAALAREASEFVACQERCTSNRAVNQTPTAADLQNKHTSWWHSTVLAVAHMVSTTGLGAVPWRGATAIGNSDDNPGRSARLQLGSAEIAAKISSGYDRDDQALPNPSSLAGAARMRALVAVRVNLAAAEKIGALSSASSASVTTTVASSRREGMRNAIDSMSSAIEAMKTRPELYIERAGLLAMMGDGCGGKGGQSMDNYRRAAASDFATALWLSHSHN